MSLATGSIYRITFESKRHNLQRQRRPYTVVICWKYLGYIQLWTIPKSITPEYDKSNTGIRTDPEENM